MGDGVRRVPLVIVWLLVSFPRSRLRLTGRVKSWACRLYVLTPVLGCHLCCQSHRRFGRGPMGYGTRAWWRTSVNWLAPHPEAGLDICYV